MINKEDVVRIGYFTKPHGIKGEIGLVTTYDIFDCQDDPFLICEMEGILVPFFIEEYRSKTDTVFLVKLETVDSDEAVREFSHREVYYPLRNMKEELQRTIPTGWAALTGYTVADSVYGVLGEITAIDQSTANTLFRIDRQGKEVLIPCVDEWIIAVDHREKRLEVSLPPGLLEL
ncbi:MAG: ribosome maturation factor RimM [Tannerellaceae bacterium]|jgi:16S rRNA processing protein RimM|nr:ribosome maturation factor RimM [Tannerellaceae bacterium]